MRSTNQCLNINGEYTLSTTNGLANMGFLSTYAWATVKTADCHEPTKQIGGAGKKMALKTMGYAKKADESVICIQCHGPRTWKGYVSGHSRHVDNVKADCSFCHNFSRPERNPLLYP